MSALAFDDVRYPPGALALWRWVEVPEDAVVEQFVRAFASLDPPGADELRSGLGEAQVGTLLGYAQRRALAALHTREVGPVRQALDALSVVPPDTVPDDRDLDLVAMLVAYAGTQLEPGLRHTVAATLHRADPGVAGLLTELLRTRLDLVDECGYREVDTPAGRVLLEDESAQYAPGADLVAAAYAVADLLEAHGYEVDAIGIGQTLHPVWVGDARNPDAVTAAGRLTGCAHLGSGLRDAEPWHEISVYLGEAANDEDAATIALAADGLGSPRHQQLAVGVQRLFALCYASSSDPRVPVAEGSLERFRPALTQILRAAVDHEV